MPVLLVSSETQLAVPTFLRRLFLNDLPPHVPLIRGEQWPALKAGGVLKNLAADA